MLIKRNNHYFVSADFSRFSVSKCNLVEEIFAKEKQYTEVYFCLFSGIVFTIRRGQYDDKMKEQDSYSTVQRLLTIDV